MRPGELVVENSMQNGRHTLALAGELDLATACDLEAAVLQVCADGAEDVTLDLSQLVFVDSAGLRAVVSARAICTEHGCSLRTTHAQKPVERLFELTGLAQKLPYRHDRSSDPATESRAEPGQTMS
jgi:anti-sigma B factor antagonist